MPALSIAVFFDLDNTLTHRPLSLARYAERFIADFAHAAESEPDLHALIECIVQADCGGYLPAGSPFKTIRETVAHAVSTLPAWRAVPGASVLDHWSRHLPSSSVAMPGAESLIDTLVNAGVHVGVISNGAQDSRVRTVQALPFARHVQQLLSSEEVGIRKPDPRIFLLAAERAGIPPRHCWYVGDHPRNDVEGAQAAGMSAIWLRGFQDWPESLAAHTHVVDHLDEVVAVLGDAHNLVRALG